MFIHFKYFFMKKSEKTVELEMFCQNISNKKIKSGFTLVELIVVITILAILATISFISFQNYKKWARDSVRVTTLKNIETWLDIYNVQSWNYPTPDEYTDIIWVWYQWYAWTDIQRVIRINKEVIDPLDNTKYLYTLNKNKTKKQLWTFLEEKNQYFFSYNFLKTYASDSNYLDRYLYTIWDKVWIFLDNETNKPIQELFNTWSLDLLSNTWTYIVQFTNESSNSWTITWTWTDLLTNISIIQNSCVLWNTLIQSWWQTIWYNKENVEYNETCSWITRKCTNGVLSWDDSYKFDTCSPKTALNCNSRNYSWYTIPVILHGSWVIVSKSITNWTSSITANCINNNLTYSSESIDCWSYVFDSNNNTCNENLCKDSRPIYSQINWTQQYNISWFHDVQSWVCHFICQAWYYWNWSDCIAASAWYYVANQWQTSQTACWWDDKYQSLTWQTSCNTVTAWYYTSWWTSTTRTTQTQCEVNNYCTAWVKTPCPVWTSSPIWSTSLSNCITNTYTVSWTFWVNANWATITWCGKSTIADTNWNFSIQADYWTNCQNITASRTNFSCITSTNWPNNLTLDFSSVSWSCSDVTPPTITSVTSSSSACNSITFTINWASDVIWLHSTPYSFDWWATWQAWNTITFSNTSYTISANLVKVKDFAWNIYTHTNSVNWTSSSCYTYNWYSSGWGSCSSTSYWWGWGSCSSSCWWWTMWRYCVQPTWTQNRTVYCNRSDSTQVSDSYCTWTKPTTSQSCSADLAWCSWSSSQSSSCNTQSCCVATVWQSCCKVQEDQYQYQYYKDNWSGNCTILYSSYTARWFTCWGPTSCWCQAWWCCAVNVTPTWNNRCATSWTIQCGWSCQ